jgi:hypothetical protein
MRVTGVIKRAVGRVRVASLATGTVLLAAGSGALLLGAGAFGEGAAARPVLDPALVRFTERDEWFWPVTGVVAEVAAMAGLVWFTVQILAAVRRWRPALDGPSRNLAGVAGGELLRATRLVPGVLDARVRLTGSWWKPRLVMNVTCDADAVPAEIRADLGRGPIARYRAAMAMRDLVVVVRFRLATLATPVEPDTVAA